MMRRSLLRLLAAPLAMRGDGLVPPMNAPPAGALVPGVQPGATSAVVIANKVIVFGPASGVFVYNGTPALGNPPIATITNATTDPFGNAVKQGIASQTAGSRFIQMISGEILLGTLSGASQITASAQEFLVDAFAASAQPGVELASPATSAANQSALVMYGESSDASKPAQMVIGQVSGTGTPGAGTSALLEVQGTAAFSGAVGAIVGGALEGWHAMTLANSWANVAGFATARYRLNAINRVEVIAAISAAAATNAAFFTLPAGYRPASQQPVGGAGASGNVPAGLAPWCRVDTGGVLTVQNTGAVGAAWQFFVQGSFSLDA